MYGELHGQEHTFLDSLLATLRSEIEKLDVRQNRKSQSNALSIGSYTTENTKLWPGGSMHSHAGTV